jgi:tubulin polyglutamylase TTLL5
LPPGLGLGASWNLLWSWSKPKINPKSLIIFQRINHFVDSKQLTRKDLLKKNLSRFTDLNVNGNNKYSQFYEIMPKTFLLPNEYTLFVREFTAIEAMKQQQRPVSTGGEGSGVGTASNIWIMKPVGLSRGRGISLINNISSLTYSQNSVIQKYLENPLCLNDYKFDLRLYVLVTSFQPLEAFVYQEGFARLSTEKYQLNETTLINKFIHLTNSSIQKNNSNEIRQDNPLTQYGDQMTETNGSKIPLLGKSGLWNLLLQEKYDPKSIWDEILLLIMKSLLAVDDKISSQPCAFELFGYDVLIDSNCKPWLIEVNSSPSLDRGTQLDQRIKNQLICDIIQLIDPIAYDRTALIALLKKRLREIQTKNIHSFSNHRMNGNSTTTSASAGNSSSENDFESQLKSIIGEAMPRQYGEEPVHCGLFERLCPNTKIFNTALKIKNKLVKESPTY